METTKNQRVHLEFTAPKAKEVFVAGSFNDWHPAVAPMIPLENGKWAKELMLPPGRYEYRFDWQSGDGNRDADKALFERIYKTFKPKS